MYLYTSANRVYDTVILPKTLRFNAFIAYSGFVISRTHTHTRARQLAEEEKNVLCPMKINNKQSKF